MAGFFKRAIDRFRTKASAAGPAIVGTMVGKPRWMPRKFKAYAEEGYVTNWVVYACINKVGEAIASIPFVVRDGGEDVVQEHELLDLLKRPNPLTGKAFFWTAVTAFYRIAGNSFLEAVRPRDDAPPMELWPLPPHHMRVVPGPKAIPERYELKIDATVVRWDVDPVTAQADVLHMRTFHPTDHWWGLSPIQPAARSIDQHNAATEHNAALLQNGARPSGLMLMKGAVNNQVDDVKAMLIDRFQSPSNAGKPMVIGGNGEVKWEQLSLSPQDLDFNEGLRDRARDICQTLGVPHVLVIPGEGTFNNRRDARLEFWENTVLPQAEYYLDELNNWLSPMFGERVEIDMDLDEIPALEPRRQTKRQTHLELYNASLITKNEARSALDFDEVATGDTFKDGSTREEEAEPEPGHDEEPGDGPDDPDEENEEDDDEEAERRREQRSRLLELKLQRNDISFISSEIDQPQIGLTVEQIFHDVYDEVAGLVGIATLEELGLDQSFQRSSDLQRWIEENAALLVKRINDTTRERIVRELGEGLDQAEQLDQLTTRMRHIFDDAARARTVAQTEATKAVNGSAQEAFRQADVAFKEWLTSRDDRVRSTHAALDGAVVQTNANFESPSGDQAPAPGQFGTAVENVNCRCAIIANFSGKSLTRQQRDDLWEQKDQQLRRAEERFFDAANRAFVFQRDAVVKRIFEIDPAQPAG